MHSTRHFLLDKNANGLLIWRANHRTVDADNVAEVVDMYKGPAGSIRKLTIYSGVHGDMAGGFDYPERQFAYEDRHNIPHNVRVENVSRVSIDAEEIVKDTTTDVLFAWCYSNMSSGGQSPYK